MKLIATTFVALCATVALANPPAAAPATATKEAPAATATATATKDEGKCHGKTGKDLEMCHKEEMKKAKK